MPLFVRSKGVLSYYQKLSSLPRESLWLSTMSAVARLQLWLCWRTSLQFKWCRGDHWSPADSTHNLGNLYKISLFQAGDQWSPLQGGKRYSHQIQDAAYAYVPKPCATSYFPIAEESRINIGFKRYFCPCLCRTSLEYDSTPSLDAPWLEQKSLFKTRIATLTHGFLSRKRLSECRHIGICQTKRVNLCRKSVCDGDIRSTLFGYTKHFLKIY